MTLKKETKKMAICLNTFCILKRRVSNTLTTNTIAVKEGSRKAPSNRVETKYY